MLIIWRGWGIIVPVILLAAFFAATTVQTALGIRTPIALGAALIVAGFLGGVGIWAAARQLESGPARVLIDKATGREFKVRKDAGSLFFIPTRYWAFISAGLGLSFGIARMLKIAF